ncbi:MAG TPA: hypothetical protein VIR00_07755, partial [Micromonosporaceae bacterium]
MLIAVGPADSAVDMCRASDRPDDAGAGAGLLQLVEEDGTPASAPRRVDDLAAEAAQTTGFRAAESPRWLWPSTADVYPALVRAGATVARVHDLELTEGLLLGSAGQWGAPRSL